MADPNGMRKVALARAWIITALGAVFIIFGLAEQNAEHVMLGFGTLSIEPLLRAGPQPK